MQKTINLALLPREASDELLVRQYICQAAGIKTRDLSGYFIVKSSLDARSREPLLRLSVKIFIREAFHGRESTTFHFREVNKASRKVLIIGAGPAGLFAALKLLESGIRPIILERGKDIRARRRDLALLNKEGIINPDSNYCFGEGGAGTYSDGKLYTRSTKRGDVNRILELFVRFGADEQILYETHPHIGTNKLPGIIAAMRKQIIDCGGEICFEKKMVDFLVGDQKIISVLTADGTRFTGEALILATGHSARDIFELLEQKKLSIESKAFALGVRIEHPQDLVDRARYPGSVFIKKGRDPYLPPASYSWVEQVNEKAVFSFCMCPGGIIAPAATADGELVVNGWSPSRRNNPFANSGIVVAVDMADIRPFLTYGNLAGMQFQRSVEEKAFEAGGGKFVAPAQRLMDFLNDSLSTDLPRCSYVPGIRSVPLKDVLPPFVNQHLQIAFRQVGKKIRGYLSNEAVLVATESRTSSPVRIPRENHSLHHPQISNLYPCGEGAGYAGGIVSAAMDGERVAAAIILAFGKQSR